MMWISACSDMTLDKKSFTQLVSKVVSPIHHSSFRWKIAQASLRLVLNVPLWSFNGTENRHWPDLSAMLRQLNKIPFTMETILIEPKLIRKDVYMLELIALTTVQVHQAQMVHCIYLKKITIFKHWSPTPSQLLDWASTRKKKFSTFLIIAITFYPNTIGILTPDILVCFSC